MKPYCDRKLTRYETYSSVNLGMKYVWALLPDFRIQVHWFISRIAIVKKLN